MWTYSKLSISDLIGRSVVLLDYNLDKQAAANIIHIDPAVLKASFTFDQIKFGK